MTQQIHEHLTEVDKGEDLPDNQHDLQVLQGGLESIEKLDSQSNQEVVCHKTDY